MAKSEFLNYPSGETKGIVSVFPMSAATLTDNAFIGMELPQLTREYGFTLPTDQEFERAQKSYGAENQITYVALIGGKARATVSFRPITTRGNNERAKRAKKFWGSLQKDDSESIHKAQDALGVHYLNAAHLSNAVTHPDWRRMGLQQKLMQEFMDSSPQPPQIILGDTRSPEEAALLAHFFGARMYRIFLGNEEITPHPDFNDPTPSSLVKANISFLGVEESPDPTLYYHKDPALPTLPMIEGFPEKIQHAFEQLTSVQPYEDETLYLPFIIARREVVSSFRR